jgi:hypothetical protein
MRGVPCWRHACCCRSLAPSHVRCILRLPAAHWAPLPPQNTHPHTPSTPCLQDADRFWDVTPPAQQELLAALQAAGNDSASGTGVSLALGWDVQRNLPLPSDHGGPLCQGALSVPLAPGTLRQLAAVLSGGAPSARLLRWGPGAGGSTGGGRGSEGDEEGGLAALYPLAWLMRGDLCSSRPLRPGDLGGGGAGEGGTGWAARWVACNASLLPQPDAWEGSAQPIGAGGAAAAAPLHQQRRLSAHSEPFLGGGATPAAWWRLDCWAVNASGAPLEPPAGQEGQGEAECGQQYGGPQLVAVLERVQGGIIGQTLSKYGIAGLYTIVVLSIGGRRSPPWPCLQRGRRQRWGSGAPVRRHGPLFQPCPRHGLVAFHPPRPTPRSGHSARRRPLPAPEPEQHAGTHTL